MFVISQIPSYCQVSSNQNKLDSILAQNGFENIRTLFLKDSIIVSFENNIYRWESLGICKAYDIIKDCTDENNNLMVFILNSDMPLLVLNNSKDGDYPMNTKDSTDFDLIIKNYSGKSIQQWKLIRDLKPTNSTFNKVDLIIYPQFFMRNVYFEKIYEVQLNVCPTLEINLWRGMKFTGQAIFPIINDFGPEGENIRPGFATLSQEFWIKNTFYTNISMGNFSNNRYGIDLKVNYPINNHWNVGINAGYTGFSCFMKGRWVKDEINTLTWFTTASYFFQKYKLQFDLSYGQYLNNDKGIRLDCTRFFGETSVGFYAIYTEDNLNGGFHFTIPFFPTKRKRKSYFRITPPRYFDWEYNAGTEFYYGRYYETKPDERPYLRSFNKFYQ